MRSSVVVKCEGARCEAAEFERVVKDSFLEDLLVPANGANVEVPARVADSESRLDDGNREGPKDASKMPQEALLVFRALSCER